VIHVRLCFSQGDQEKTDAAIVRGGIYKDKQFVVFRREIFAASIAHFLPDKSCGVKHRPINAYSPIVPVMGGLNPRHTTKTNAYAASHRRFQG
jgi:hypothetical protein